MPAIIYQNDCIVTTGESLLKAFDRLEVAEATAHSIISASEIGGIVPITDDEITDLKAAFNLVD